jgi:MFS family permease
LANQGVLGSTKEKKSKFFYGYIIILASYFIVFISWGSQYSFGVFFKPVLNEFHWTRAITSGAYSINMILTGVFYIVAGRLVDRFGPRIILSAGACFIAAGYLLMTTVNSIWQYYLFYGVLISLGLGCVVVPLMSTVARWFTKGRGLASGIVMSGIGIGIVVMPQIANALIAKYDWRTSFLVIGIAALVLIIGFAQLLKRAPEHKNPSIQEAKIANIQAQGLSVREAIRTRHFWIISLFTVFFGYTVQSVMAHIVPHTTDIGFSATIAATVLSAIGLVSVAAKIWMGSLADKLGTRNVTIIISVFLAIAFILIIFDGNLWILFPAAAIFSMGYSGTSATHSPITADYFGLKAHGILLGINEFVYAIGGALGSFLAGFIFDASGSYQWAFIICLLASVGALILSVVLQPAARKIKAKAQALTN